MPNLLDSIRQKLRYIHHKPQLSGKKPFFVITLAILAISIPLTVYLAQRSQDPRQHAAVDPVGAQSGRWEPLMQWPMVAAHMAQFYTGEIMFWQGFGEYVPTNTMLWNPVSNTFTSIPINSAIFCVGQSLLADGRLIVMGGHQGTGQGIKDVSIFNPENKTWQRIEDMQFARWYPSVTTLSDGRAVALNGKDENKGWVTAVESFDPKTNDISRFVINTNNLKEAPYPYPFLQPDGRLGVFGPASGGLFRLDLSNRAWYKVGETGMIRSSIAVYRPGMVLATGGGKKGKNDDILEDGGAGKNKSKKKNNNNNKKKNNNNNKKKGKGVKGVSTVVYENNYSEAGEAEVTQSVLQAKNKKKKKNKKQEDKAVSTAKVIDMNSAKPTVRQVRGMNYPRYHHNLVMLPDGKVLAVGGVSVIEFVPARKYGILPVEMWDPDTEQWTVLSAMSDPRMYHSTALLLPDGRVLSAGGGNGGGDALYKTAQIFQPPYLFKGVRPVINSAPESMEYGDRITVETQNANDINKVSLVRLASVTHRYNFDQRFLWLEFSKSGNTLTIDAPENGNIAPPGYYMLFILNSQGVPSVASIIKMEGNGVVQAGPRERQLFFQEQAAPQIEDTPVEEYEIAAPGE